VPTGLVSRWDGEGSGADATGTNPGQLLFGVAFVPGRRGLAFSFDGVSLLQAGTTGMPLGSADRTIELWTRLDAEPSFQGFFAGYGEFGTPTAAYELGSQATALFFSNWGSAVFGPSLSLATWHHWRRGVDVVVPMHGQLTNGR
jgi:hypothetical protein